jgi:hypothetical protein
MSDKKAMGEAILAINAWLREHTVENLRMNAEIKALKDVVIIGLHELGVKPKGQNALDFFNSRLKKYTDMTLKVAEDIDPALGAALQRLVD